MSNSWASGWATGDIVSTTEFKKSMGAIYDTTLSGAAATVDITGIPQTYAHLRLEMYARGDTAATEVIVGARFNGDTAANYDYEYVQANGGAAAGAQSLGATSALVGIVAAASATASVFDMSDIAIPAYAGMTGQKVLAGTATTKRGTAGALFMAAVGGWWRSTAAITQLTLFPVAGNFVAGSRFTLYAMGA